MENIKETTLCYMIDGNLWLMLHRNTNKDDLNYDKWLGVGGKLKEDELPKECILREIKEETNLDALDVLYRGVVHFKQDTYEEVMYVYTCSKFSNTLDKCDEGEFKWVDKKDILSLNLWEGDKYFLQKLLSDDMNKFEILLEYDIDGNLIYASDGGTVWINQLL